MCLHVIALRYVQQEEGCGSFQLRQGKHQLQALEYLCYDLHQHAFNPAYDSGAATACDIGVCLTVGPRLLQSGGQEQEEELLSVSTDVTRDAETISSVRKSRS